MNLLYVVMYWLLLFEILIISTECRDNFKKLLEIVPDNLFENNNKLLRELRYSKDGIVECYTCGKVHPVKEMSAGHGIGGRNNAVLFLEAVIEKTDNCSTFLSVFSNG